MLTQSVVCGFINIEDLVNKVTAPIFTRHNDSA